jgi:hypothetical protein
MRIWREHASCKIYPLRQRHQIANEIGILLIKVDVHIDDAISVTGGRCGLLL